VLEKHAYMPQTGWNQPPGVVPGLHDVCPSTTSGFPLASSREVETPVNCLQAKNSLARSINYALYFAAAAIIAVAVVERIKDRL
jgi:hypothetical protein